MTRCGSRSARHNPRGGGVLPQFTDSDPSPHWPVGEGDLALRYESTGSAHVGSSALRERVDLPWRHVSGGTATRGIRDANLDDNLSGTAAGTATGARSLGVTR